MEKLSRFFFLVLPLKKEENRVKRVVLAIAGRVGGKELSRDMPTGNLFC
jgi:hypothetical protein